MPGPRHSCALMPWVLQKPTLWLVYSLPQCKCLRTHCFWHSQSDSFSLSSTFAEYVSSLFLALILVSLTQDLPYSPDFLWTLCPSASVSQVVGWQAYLLLFCCSDRTPQEINLRNKGFILAYSPGGIQSFIMGRHICRKVREDREQDQVIKISAPSSYDILSPARSFPPNPMPDRVSIYSPGYLGNHSVDQAALEFTEIYLPYPHCVAYLWIPLP